jgi:stress response protein YsnF
MNDKIETQIREAAAAAKAKKEDKPVEVEVEYEEVFIDLPPHSSHISIDGRHFQQGASYKVTKAQAASMRDIMSRAWAHEQEVRGQRKPFDAYRRQREFSLRG